MIKIGQNVKVLSNVISSENKRAIIVTPRERLSVIGLYRNKADVITKTGYVFRISVDKLVGV